MADGERDGEVTFRLVRRSLILAVGLFGLIAEILTPADARPLLLVTDLILVGIVPVEVFLHSRFRSRDDYREPPL